MSTPRADLEAGSQTLSRGLRAIELIGESGSPFSVSELSVQLGIHRSMGYRLVRTLEQHGFVQRSSAGALELGVRLSTLARGVAKDLQAAAAPELAMLAEELSMTAFLVTYDGESAVTLSSVEPQNVETTLAKKPGSRHSINQGAPGKVIRSQIDPVTFPPKAFEVSQNEVLPGIASIAVPLVVTGNQPAALAVLFLPGNVDEVRVAHALQLAAARVEAQASR